MLLVAPFAWVSLTARPAARRDRLDKQGVPSTEKAAYEPVIDPAERV